MKKTVTLSNGVEIPEIGLGTWKTTDGESAVQTIKTAVKYGYRHIDTAARYENEKGVGLGVLNAGISREELFVTSKVWNTERGYEKTMKAFEKTMSDLGLEYLDLYLIHWPANKKYNENNDEINLDTWRALTELYKSGRVKAIGVSNFKPHHLRSIMDTEVCPMINQIEYHPGFTQDETVKFCKENGIAVEAWSPLGRGKVLENDLIVELSKKYGKTPAQICIRWVLQNGVIPLPKSVTESRIAENIDVYDFEISEEDMKKIDSLPVIGESGLDSDEVDF